MPHSVFDLAGPVMIGPSSSHTAGACKIGQIARALFRGTPTHAKFYLYGSFAAVYKGHSTDKALLAGVLKMWISDSNIKNAFEIAEKKGLQYEFSPYKSSTPEHHSNTVRIILRNQKRRMSIVGASIGGGEVKITQINNIPLNIDMAAGRFFTLLIGHENKRDVIDTLCGKLIEWGCPITKKETYSIEKNSLTILSIEDYYLKLHQVQDLEKLPGIQFVRSLTRLIKE